LSVNASSWAAVEPASRHRVPARHVHCAPLDHVGHQPHRGIDREAPLLLSDVLLEDVGLDRPRQLVWRHALPFGGHDVEGEHHGGRRVDRHRHADVLERDVGEQRLHVRQAVDRHPLATDLAQRPRRIRVVPHQRGHVEGRRQSRLAVVEQVAEAQVRLLGRAEARELAHSPQPAAIHRAVDAARVWKLTGKPDRFVGIDGEIGLGVQRLDRLAGDGRERRVPLRRATEGLALPALEACQARLRGHRRSLGRGLDPSTDRCLVFT
jgi:hypothetical protein